MENAPAQSIGYPFSEHIDAFVHRAESLYTTFTALMPTFVQFRNEANKELVAFIEKYKDLESVDEAEGSFSASIPANAFGQFNRLDRQFRGMETTTRLFPEILLVSLVSQYDAFLGHLIRGIFHTKPDALNASEKNVSISELMRFGSIDAAREHVIEKEIESVLRRSHAEHFDWLESKLGMKLRNGLSIWPTFIELTERRNLFVHTDGIVSSQYITVCKNHKVEANPAPNVGHRISVTAKYLKAAYYALLEIGIKLGYVLWRKLLPDSADQASTYLNNACLDLIQKRHYELACTLLEFPFTLPGGVSAETTLLMKLNLAQAFKWRKQPEKCTSILGEIAWGTLADKFELARAVLEDDFENAAKIMRRIGPSGSLHQHEYGEWPIFREFRKSTVFLDAYKQIFGTEFVHHTANLQPPSPSEAKTEPPLLSEKPPISDEQS